MASEREIAAMFERGDLPAIAAVRMLADLAAGRAEQLRSERERPRRLVEALQARLWEDPRRPVLVIRDLLAEYEGGQAEPQPIAWQRKPVTHEWAVTFDDGWSLSEWAGWTIGNSDGWQWQCVWVIPMCRPIDASKERDDD